MPDEEIVVAPVEAPVVKDASIGDATSPAESGDTPNPADSATAAPPGAKPELTPEQAAKRESRRVQNKLDRAFREAAEAKARAEFAERRAQEIESKFKPAPDPDEPRLEDFADINEFGKAQREYGEKKALKESGAKAEAERARQSQAAMRASWAEKAERAADKYDDFPEALRDLKPDSPMTVGLMSLDNGDDVAYHLIKNPAEDKRIGSLSPVAQFLELGRLSAKLSATPPKAQTPSDAPAPIKPVGGSAPSTKKLSEMSQDEFDKRREAQIRARR